MTLTARILLAVAAGGAVGSLLRWFVDVLLPEASGTLPWGTLLVNVLGSALLGIVVEVLDREGGSGAQGAFLGTGVLGGFTTFSTYAVQVALLGDTDPAVALTYFVVTPLLCVAAAGLAIAGLRRARRTT